MKKLLLLLIMVSYNLTIGQSIISVSPDNGNLGQNLSVSITGQDVDFYATSPTINVSFIDQFSNVLPVSSFDVYYENSIYLYLQIPGYAVPGAYALNVYDSTGTYNITLPDAFTVNNQYTYSIQGNIRYDSNSNGCDAADPFLPNQKLNFVSGSNTGTMIANQTGFYNYYDVNLGNNSFTPIFENPSYFTVSPPSASVNISSTNTLFVQDFCVTPNGVHNDLEVTIFPYSTARPGFNSYYYIVYKNKGNQIENGTIALNFDDNVMDLISSSPTINSQGTNTLNWNFSNLLPFETRYIFIIMNINSPVESPPVNVGDSLNFVTTITGATDETPLNNISTFHQTVVGSYDPNDKTCIEGQTIPVTEVGKDLHYVIRFENTGTANAENVVVRDIIDTSKFDITTLRPLGGRHPFTTKITNTNQVEFIFQNINLPFDDANNDGFVAFKIKTKPTLTIGSTINNTANIYFDYNAPITTNTYTTTVTALGVNDFDFDTLFTLSPVPAKTNLSITTKTPVLILKIDIYNTLGQLVTSSNANSLQSIDVSPLKTGNYFIKITSDKGTATGKFIKE